MKNLQLLTVFILLVLVSCSSPEEEIFEEERFDGNFEATLSGDISRTFKGEASFVHGILTTKSAAENGSTMAINLLNTDNEDELITMLVGQLGDKDGLNSGTYEVNLEPDEGDPLVNIGAFLEGSSTILVNETGSITLTKINDNKVEGSFEAELTNFNGINVEIKGKFEAKGITEKL